MDDQSNNNAAGATQPAEHSESHSPANPCHPGCAGWRGPLKFTLPPRAGSYIASSEDAAAQSLLLADQCETARAAARLLEMAHSVRRDRPAAAELVRRSARLLRSALDRLEAYGEGRLV